MADNGGDTCESFRRSEVVDVVKMAYYECDGTLNFVT